MAGVLGATTFITINHGSKSKWELAVECNYFDNNILGLVSSSDFR